MKISVKNGGIIAIVAIAAILLFTSLGINIGPLLYFAFLILVGYIIIDGINNFANRFIDALAKRQAISNEEINAKIEVMMQRMQVIEDKVDRTNVILEKVSE